jgi:hypothetical protein
MSLDSIHDLFKEGIHPIGTNGRKILIIVVLWSIVPRVLAKSSQHDVDGRLQRAGAEVHIAAMIKTLVL